MPAGSEDVACKHTSTTSTHPSESTQPAGAVAASPHALDLISDADLQQLDADISSLMDGWGDVSNDHWQQMLGDLDCAATPKPDAAQQLGAGSLPPAADATVQGIRPAVGQAQADAQAWDAAGGVATGQRGPGKGKVVPEELLVAQQVTASHAPGAPVLSAQVGCALLLPVCFFFLLRLCLCLCLRSAQVALALALTCVCAKLCAVMVGPASPTLP
jgi:hypothetical protein